MYIIISYVFNDHKSNKVVADEIVTFAKRLKDNDLKRAYVILDLTNKELVKCRSFSLYGKVLNNGEPDVTYQRLLDYVREQPNL